jgi:hypothetical protein
MVLQETLENAMKYSKRRDDCTLELSIQCSARSIAITCTSEPDPEHLDQLREELAQLCAQDPEAAYVAAFQRASVEPHGSSRLGLARMRYEGKFELEMDDDSDGRIRITAVSQL